MTAIDLRPGTEATGSAVAAALRTIDANIGEFGDRYPGDTTVHERYRLRAGDDGLPTGANLGWTMIVVPDACDCFDLPDDDGGTIPGRDIQAAHVATLAAVFCAVMTTAETTGGQPVLRQAPLPVTAFRNMSNCATSLSISVAAFA